MEQIDSGKTSDEEFSLFRNYVLVRTLKFYFGISGLLGEGGGIVSTTQSRT